MEVILNKPIDVQWFNDKKEQYIEKINDLKRRVGHLFSTERKARQETFLLENPELTLEKFEKSIHTWIEKLAQCSSVEQLDEIPSFFLSAIKAEDCFFNILFILKPTAIRQLQDQADSNFLVRQLGLLLEETSELREEVETPSSKDRKTHLDMIESLAFDSIENALYGTTISILDNGVLDAKGQQFMIKYLEEHIKKSNLTKELKEKLASKLSQIKNPVHYPAKETSCELYNQFKTQARKLYGNPLSNAPAADIDFHISDELKADLVKVRSTPPLKREFGISYYDEGICRSAAEQVYFMNRCPTLVFKYMGKGAQGQAKAGIYLRDAQDAQKIVQEQSLHLLKVPQLTVISVLNEKNQELFFIAQEKCDLVAGDYVQVKELYERCLSDPDLVEYATQILYQVVDFLGLSDWGDIKYDNVPLTKDGQVCLMDLDKAKGSLAANSALYKMTPIRLLDQVIERAKKYQNPRIDAEKYHRLRDRNIKKIRKKFDYIEWSKKKIDLKDLSEAQLRAVVGDSDYKDALILINLVRSKLDASKSKEFATPSTFPLLNEEFRQPEDSAVDTYDRLKKCCSQIVPKLHDAGILFSARLSKLILYRTSISV